jgi:2-aminoadipate transaminase
MRLNFSGSDDGEIEEGVRRIGKVIAQQVELYSTLTREPADAHMPAAEGEGIDAIDSAKPGHDEVGDVLPFRREESA